jgi:AcrR family transcriptional regulator
MHYIVQDGFRMKNRRRSNQAIPKARRNGSREAIVEAAERLFLERGFGAVSMDELASAAGVARRTVYNQFTSKEEIFREMLLRVSAQLATPFPPGIVGPRFVDPSPTISAEAIRKAVNLNFALSASGCPVYQLHNELHHLLGRFVRWFVKLRHYRLLLFLLLLQMAHLLSGFSRFALGHLTPQIGSGERSGVAIFGHNVSLLLCNARAAPSCSPK